MNSMFRDADDFSHRSKDVNCVAIMPRMFWGAYLIHQPIGAWDVSKVKAKMIFFIELTPLTNPRGEVDGA